MGIMDKILTAARWIAYWDGAEVEQAPKTDNAPTLEQQREEKIKALGNRWVLHPRYDSSQNPQHAPSASPRVLSEVRAKAVAGGRL